MVSEVYLLTLTYFLTTKERNKMTQTTVTTAVNTIANNAVVTANAESFTNDNAKAMLTTNSLSFIELLKNEQEVWADNAFKNSNDLLYAILAKCYAKYEEMCLATDNAKTLRTQLDDYMTLHNIAVNKKSHTIHKIVKCVFGADRRRVSAYSIVLRTANIKKIKSADIADYIRNNGGVEEIRLAKNGNVLSTKQKAEVAKTTVASAVLAEISSEAIAKQVDAACIGQQVVFVATQQANGKFAINAVTNSTTAINAALSAYYSANKNSIAKQVKERSVASNDAKLNEAITNTAA